MTTAADAKAGGLQRQAALTGFLLLFAIVGLALYGLPFFYDFFVRELGWSRTTVASGNAIGKLVAGPLFGFLAGWFIDRKGPRSAMVFGVAMATAAVFGLSTVTGLMAFYVFYFFNAVGYVCAGPLPNQVIIARSTETGRGKALGFAYLGIGLGGALVPLIAAALVDTIGWRSALQVLSGLILLCTLPPILLLPRKLTAPPPAKHTPDQSLRPVLRDPRFYLLLVGSMCSVGAVGGTMQHLKLYLSLDHDFGQMQAAGLLSAVLWVSLVGRLLMGWLADRLGAKPTAVFIYGLVALGAVLLLTLPPGPALYLFAVIFGLGLGGEYLIVPVLAAELFGTMRIGRMLGIILTFDGLAEALSPMLIGSLRDSTGSYQTAFVALIAMALVGLAAILGLRKRTEPAQRSSYPQRAVQG